MKKLVSILALVLVVGVYAAGCTMEAEENPFAEDKATEKHSTEESSHK